MIIEEKYNLKRIIKEGAGTLIGAAIMALGTSLFLLPNQLSTGGVAGIATIIYYFIKIRFVSVCTGNFTVIVVPIFSWLVTSIVPSDNSTILFTIAKPKPLPSEE